MLGMSLYELLIMIAIVMVLSMTGMWPRIIRGLRELRGEQVEDRPEAPITSADLCFKMLGISPSARWDEVEKAYRSKAKIHHPDHGGDEDAMRALNDAYTTLKRYYNR